MEEFKFTLDPEKFKKNVQAKFEEERSVEDSSENVASEEIFDNTPIEDDQEQFDDVVVLSDDESDKIENEIEETFKAEKKQLKQNQKKLKKLEKLQEKELRKAKKAEEKKHKGNNILFYIAFILLFLIISVALCLTVFFNIEEVEVENSTIYTAEEVVSASGINLGDNVFLISADTLTSNICRNLPYVKNVTVEKGLNNKIIFKVEETYDYMVVDSSGGFAVLSPEKKVLRFIEGSYPNHLVYVFGLKISNVHTGETAVFTQATASNAVDELIPLLISSGFDKVKSISVFDMSAIKFIYDNRICVNIGPNDNLEYKLTFAKQALNGSIEENAEGVLNLAQLSSKNREIQFRKESLFSPKRIKDDMIEQEK